MRDGKMVWALYKIAIESHLSNLNSATGHIKNKPCLNGNTTIFSQISRCVLLAD